MVASLCIAMGVGLHLIASDFVIVVLGLPWVPAIPFFEWLAIYGLFSGLVVSVQSFFIAIDRFSLYGGCYIVYSIILIGALTATALSLGVEGVAPVRTLVMAALFCGIYGLMLKHELLNTKHLLDCFWRPVLAALAMMFTVRYIQSVLESGDAIGLAIQILIGAITFLFIQGLCLFVVGRPEGVEKKIQASLLKLRQ